MTFEKIIGLWPSTAEFSRDIGVSIDLASKYQRGIRSIPDDRWKDVVDAAKARGLKVTADDLMDAARRFRIAAARRRSAA